MWGWGVQKGRKGLQRRQSLGFQRGKEQKEGKKKVNHHKLQQEKFQFHLKRKTKQKQTPLKEQSNYWLSVQRYCGITFLSDTQKPDWTAPLFNLTYIQVLSQCCLKKNEFGPQKVPSKLIYSLILSLCSSLHSLSVYCAKCQCQITELFLRLICSTFIATSVCTDQGFFCLFPDVNSIPSCTYLENNWVFKKFIVLENQDEETEIKITN